MGRQEGAGKPQWEPGKELGEGAVSPPALSEGLCQRTQGIRCREGPLGVFPMKPQGCPTSRMAVWVGLLQKLPLGSPGRKEGSQVFQVPPSPGTTFLALLPSRCLRLPKGQV